MLKTASQMLKFLEWSLIVDSDLSNSYFKRAIVSSNRKFNEIIEFNIELNCIWIKC